MARGPPADCRRAAVPVLPPPARPRSRDAAAAAGLSHEHNFHCRPDPAPTQSGIPAARSCRYSLNPQGNTLHWPPAPHTALTTPTQHSSFRPSCWAGLRFPATIKPEVDMKLFLIVRGKVWLCEVYQECLSCGRQGRTIANGTVSSARLGARTDPPRPAPQSSLLTRQILSVTICRSALYSAQFSVPPPATGCR